MSVIAKILVVLNLVLAVVFLGASATYLGQKEGWKLRYEKMEGEKNQTIQALEANLRQATDNYQTQQQMTSSEQTKNTELRTRIEAKEEEYGKLREQHNTLLGQYERLSQVEKDQLDQIKQLMSDKDGLITARDQALQEKAAAVKEANDAVTEQRRLETEGLNAKDMIAALETQLLAANEDLDKTKLVVKAYEDKIGPLAGVIAPPKINAVVAGVDTNLNIVMLSVGRDDGVKEGFEFTIYRGSEYIGQIVIDRVERDYCSGASKKNIEKSAIQVGDQATTRY
jgi:delta 1-pyrroline-5-carboxylate dehydrogenase